MAKTVDKDKAPTHLNLYVYQVGFGDCFLLEFVYGRSISARRRHVLIDFGTTGTREEDTGSHMLAIARDIAQKCDGGTLMAVVATHRHADHISGFATKADGSGPGDVIRDLKPKMVLQPWTEDLSLDENATAPRQGVSADADNQRAFRALQSMNELAQRVAGMTAQAANSEKGASGIKGLPVGVVERLDFLGRDNTKNLPAVENLAQMGEAGRAVYAHFGTSDPFRRLLPGVKTHVLGPPTVKQSPEVQKQRSSDDDEFWKFRVRAFDSGQAAAKVSNAEAGGGKRATKAGTQAASPFSEKFRFKNQGKLPREIRWAARRIQEARGAQMLGIVTMLDKAMNNTSLILLIEVGGKRLLFPGDAQIENWTYALKQPDVRRLLEEVDVYKVGHHGSTNATPQTLWKGFKKRGGVARKDRMTAVLSTMSGKHGDAAKKTEVPRKRLVDQLAHDTHLHSTQDLIGGQLCEVIRIEF